MVESMGRRGKPFVSRAQFRAVLLRACLSTGLMLLSAYDDRTKAFDRACPNYYHCILSAPSSVSTRGSAMY